MIIFNYISNYSIPILILIIVGYAFYEKNNVFDNFVDGVKEGTKIVYNIFPTLIGLFIAIGMMRSSGLLDFIISCIFPIVKTLKIPTEILPLAIFRPVSGSAAIAIATDIMKQNGVDSLIGKMASVIMGSTETTLYTIAVYTSCIKVKNTRGIIYAALFGDFIGIVVSLIICHILW